MTILTMLTAMAKTLNLSDCGYVESNLHTSEKLKSGKRNGELKALMFHTAGTVFSFRPRYRLKDIRVAIFLRVSWHEHLATASHLPTTASFVMIHHSRDPETAHSDSRWWLSEGSAINSKEPHRPINCTSHHSTEIIIKILTSFTTSSISTVFCSPRNETSIVKLWACAQGLYAGDTRFESRQDKHLSRFDFVVQTNAGAIIIIIITYSASSEASSLQSAV